MIKEDPMFAAIVITLIAISNNPEFMYYAGVFLAAALGIVMRVGFHLNKGTFKLKTLALQVLIGFPITYLTVIIYGDSHNLQIWVFFFNFMALFLLDVLDKLGRVAILEWVQWAIDKVKGKEGK